MASKFHPLVDGFNRHLRKESREPQLTKAARQPYGDENRVRIADEHGNYEEHETTGSEEKRSVSKANRALSSALF